jgi:polar amino acid transport system substrate-binding protein
MYFRKFVACLALGAALTMSSSAAFAADTLKTIKDRGTIVVAIDFTHPPYGMLNTKAEQTGTDFDIAKLIASDLGVKLQVLPVNGPNRIPFLLTDKADIVIASFSITDDRKKVIAFTRPYATEPILILAPGKDSIKSPSDLAGKSVAVARGNTADLDLTNVIKEKDVKDVQIVRYLDEATARTAVSSGQQNIFAASLADAIAVKQASPNEHFEFQFRMSEDPLGIGVRQDDTELLTWLNDWVGKNLKNGKLNDIYLKYFGVPISKTVMN